MKTTLLTPETDENAVKTAAELIRAGEVVGMPTETVYGLAANALNGEAVKKIFLAKGRPQDNPLIVHIADFDQIYDLCPAVPPQAKLLADAFWPGPLTMIVPKGDCIPDEVSCGLDTVGIRLPSHPMARALIRESGVPLAAPQNRGLSLSLHHNRRRDESFGIQSPPELRGAHRAGRDRRRAHAVLDGIAYTEGLH